MMVDDDRFYKFLHKEVMLVTKDGFKYNGIITLIENSNIDFTDNKVGECFFTTNFIDCVIPKNDLKQTKE